MRYALALGFLVGLTGCGTLRSFFSDPAAPPTPPTDLTAIAATGGPILTLILTVGWRAVRRYYQHKEDTAAAKA